jgi:hypothetical protein
MIPLTIMAHAANAETAFTVDLIPNLSISNIVYLIMRLIAAALHFGIL